MKVVIFSDTYPPEINGVATSARNLYRTLKAHGDEVIVVTTNPFDNEFYYQDDIMRIPGITIKKLYGYVFPTFPWNEKGARIIEDFKPDVVHIQTDGMVGQMGFLLSSKMHVASVYTFHTMIEDYTYYASRGHFDRAAKSVVRSYVRYKAKSADEFITPSEKIREYMRSICVDAHIAVIPTGIDFDAFARSNFPSSDVASLKKKLGIDPEAYVILSLGRVAKEKSIDICIKGYASFLKKKPSRKTVMVIVGGGPAVGELQSLCEKLGIKDQVIFVGPVDPDTVPFYYALGDCFVSASTSETQGLTFMEAMASDNILLARYDDTLADLIHDGENGFFFFDERDMPEKIERVIALSANERSSIFSFAHESIKPYSLEQFYESIKGVYQRAIKKNY